MSDTLSPLALRRIALVAQAAEQRIALAASIEPWRQPLALADRGLAALQVIGKYPVWIASGAVSLALLRPTRVGTWLRRCWLAWRLLQGLRGR
jgi:hypothetical protein